MTETASGFGAGTKELANRPNVTQVVIGEAADQPATDGQPVVLLEANVDDVTGEVLGHAIGEVLSAGAHDAWITPLVMKKGRPAHTVHALVDPALVPQVGRAPAETGTRCGATDSSGPSPPHERVVVDDLSVRGR
jgi:hypothetical protein